MKCFAVKTEHSFNIIISLFSVHNNKITYYDKANVETPFCYNATVMYFVSESLCLMCYLCKYTCSQQQGNFKIFHTPPN